MGLRWPWYDRSGRLSWLKGGTLLMVCLPGLWVSWEYVAGRYGPTPFAGATYWSGVWATAVLLLALGVTPAARLFRWPQVLIVRRMIGVTALVYTIAHVLCYFALRSWDFTVIASETVSRLSLNIASVATLGLIALGVTSVDAAIRRMGARRWQRLHRCVYLLAALALLHYLLSPGIYSDQFLLLGIYCWLMGWRLLDRHARGGQIPALLGLAAAAWLITMISEAGWIRLYHGEDFVWTLANNVQLTFGLAPGWKVLALGLVATAVTALRTRRTRAGNVSEPQQPDVSSS